MKIHNKKLTVTIAIPAYNEEKNIRKLLYSLLSQKEIGFTVSNIIAISDASTDETALRVKEIKNKKIKVINHTKRIGKPQTLNEIFKLNASDILVLLDADVLPATKYMLSRLVDPIIKNSNVGLVSGNIKPIKAKNFVQKAIEISRTTYDSINNNLNGGNNPHNCHGNVMALSKKFARSVVIPKEVFSDDSFLYLSCIAKKFKFVYAPEAEVFFSLSSTVKDAVRQYSRFVNGDSISQTLFAEIVKKEYVISQKTRIKYLLFSFLKHPIHSLFIFLVVRYCEFFGKRKTTGVWRTAQSTKNLTKSLQI